MEIGRRPKNYHPAKKEPKHPPHVFKQVHRSVDFKNKVKYVSLFFECQFPGCNEKYATVNGERIKR